MISLGVAEAIVDLVETGSTLVDNHLRIFNEIGQHQTLLIQGQNCCDPELANRIARRIEGVTIVRRKRTTA